MSEIDEAQTFCHYKPFEIDIIAMLGRMLLHSTVQCRGELNLDHKLISLVGFRNEIPELVLPFERMMHEGEAVMPTAR